MNTYAWNEIIDDYKNAKDRLWYKKGNSMLQPADGDAHYYLWSAYYKAQRAESVNHLWLGRILYLIADKYRFKFSDYDILNKYAEPAFHEFEKAMASNEEHPFDKEFESARQLYKHLKYHEDNQKDCLEKYAQIINCLEGDPLPEHFDFYDSQPQSFETHGNKATLSFEHDNSLIILHFDDVYEININTDPVTDFIQEFYCYPDFGRNNLILFDIGFYKILCAHIRVQVVTTKPQL